MIKIFKHFKTREWSFVCLSVLVVCAQVWFELRIPDYMSEITGLITAESEDLRQIALVGVRMLLCALGSLTAAVLVGFFAAQTAATLSRRIRGKLFRRVQSYSAEDINAFSAASLITRTTNDIGQITMSVAVGLTAVLRAPIMAGMAITKIQNTGRWQWSALTLGAVVALVCFITLLNLYVIPKFRKIQKLTDNINRIARENLTGLQVVRAYNAEEFEEKRFETANEELTSTFLKTQSAMSMMNPMMNFVMNSLTLGIYWVGALLILSVPAAEAFVIFSDMVVFSSYAMQVIGAFIMLTMIFIMLPRALVSAKRIQEVLDRHPSIEDGSEAAGDPALCGQIEFRNVRFRYPNAEDDVLQGITFTAKPGETTAIIGSTGSGKTTLVQLAMRLYDVSGGEVLVDGRNVKEYTGRALRNKFGYVPQKAILFSGSVASNVAYGENDRAAPNSADIEKAVSIAQGTEFVQALEGGYEGMVAQGGANFSGGQKQRLSIARAVCRNPNIYIFDDSFSALDYKTERALRGALKKETGNATCLIVAQRIGTIRDADQIIVLDNGVIAGIGTHDTLLKSCEVYREIALSQLSKEELA